MNSEAKWAAAQGDGAVGKRPMLTTVARLGIAVVVVLIFAVLPLHAQTENARAAGADSSAKTLADLPSAALPAISSALGHDDARYGVRKTADGYAAQNAANHLAAHYSAKGVEVRSQNVNLGFEFQGWGYGEQPANKNNAAVAPRVNANRVEYRRGALTEWYVNGPFGIEQGFTISQPPVTLPDSSHGALGIALRLRGNLSASVEPGRHALVLLDHKGAQALRYGPLLAYDASGRELESWMEVQDGSLRLRVNTVGARYPIIVDPWVQAAQLTNSSGAAGDYFGASVAIDGTGDTVVVGSEGVNQSQGAVYVFVENGSWATTSTFTAELTASDGAPGDIFGFSVGISGNGDTIVVGAPFASFGSSLNQGAAYVFVEPTAAGGWASKPSENETAKFTGSDATIGNTFAYSVGINESGDTIVAGNFYANISGNTDQGAAYVFARPTNGWASEPTPYGTETTELTASDGKPNDALGSSVAISGTTVVVGALQATATTLRQGAVYVFNEPDTGWEANPTYSTFAAKLTASTSTATANSYLGTSVGINESGNTIVAGAYQTNIGSNAGQGAAYVFVEPTAVGGWASQPSENETAELIASDGAAMNEFGSAVAISGNTVVVGTNSIQGEAYFFAEPTPGGWASQPSENETQELTASGGAAADNLHSVAISGTTVATGALQTTIGSHANQGAAYVFTYGGGGPTLTISEVSGSQQTAVVSTAFSAPLVARVVNGSGTGVSGVTVTFSAPASGASGTFSGGVNTAVTDASGMATSNVFTANGTAGSYTVTATATAPNVSGTASFVLTNAAAQIGTTLTVSTSSSDHGDALPSGDALAGNPITVSFTVAQKSGSVTPTGNVVVSDGLGDTCAPSPVVLTSASAGAGSCTLTIALPGTATLTATYTPNTNAFSGSTGSVSESVVEIFACGPSVPEQIVKQGAMITYSFTVCVAGNANAVPLVADVVDCVPRGKCTLGITEVGQTGVYTVSVTVVTECGDCKTLTVPQPRSWPGSWLLTLFWLCALIALLMASQLAQRNRARPWVVYVASFLFAIALCGMSACNNGGTSDTPVGVYTVSVKAVAGNFNVVVPANVMVEK